MMKRSRFAVDFLFLFQCHNVIIIMWILRYTFSIAVRHMWIFEDTEVFSLFYSTLWLSCCYRCCCSCFCCCFALFSWHISLKCSIFTEDLLNCPHYWERSLLTLHPVVSMVDQRANRWSLISTEVCPIQLNDEKRKLFHQNC